MSRVTFGPVGSFPVGGTYTTAFPTDENPLCEKGLWLNGATEGSDWKDMQTTGGLAYGPLNFVSSNYDDATSILAGTWSPNHQVEAVVHSINQQTGSNFQEVEVRLRCAISPHVISGYEVNWRCTHDGTQYHQIIWWYGRLGTSGGCANGCAFAGVTGSFDPNGNGMVNTTACFDTSAATTAWGTTTYGGLFDGDTVGASIVNNQITTWIIHSGTKVLLQQFSDTAASDGGALFKTGSPGIGHWLHGAGNTNDFGFTSMTAKEL